MAIKVIDISDIKYPDYFIGKKSKSNTKMVRYLDLLLKNKFFNKKIKELKKEKNKESNFKKLPLLKSIPDEYKKLRRQALSATNNKYSKLVEEIINKYGISFDSIDLAIAMIDGNYDYVQSQIYDINLCSINDDYSNYLFPLNPADDFIVYNLRLKRRIMAYPISIGISPRATKDDIINFINTNWWWIKNGINEHGLKALKMGKRKRDKVLINIIWQYRGLPLKKIKNILDKEYPQNGLIYNEIQDIITYEKKKRLKKLT